MTFRIVRDYGGVMGLHVALNVFSEEAEGQLWAIFGVGGAAREEHDGEKYVDLNANPRMFPAGARVTSAPGARRGRTRRARAPAAAKRGSGGRDGALPSRAARSGSARPCGACFWRSRAPTNCPPGRRRLFFGAHGL